MNKILRPIPFFKSEAAERAFWESVDSTKHIDWSKAKKTTYKKLRPSTETISLRMPEEMLNTIRSHAKRLDVPYQSLIKFWIAEKVATFSKKKSKVRRQVNESGTTSQDSRKRITA